MHAERRADGVSLLPPTRTTRMNGGPRPATVKPLPPFRNPDADNRSRGDYASPGDGRRGRTMSSAAAPVRRFTSKSVEAAGAFDRGERTVAPYTFEPAASDSASTDEAVTEFDEFPLDAFIIPEGTERLPAGLAEARSRQRQTANDLAARLESLAGRLRRDGYTALARQTVHGDPLDALIAGILAGYLVEISD